MRIALFLIACLVISGCATRAHVANDYDSVIKENPRLARRTVVLFLVDGLSEQTLQAALIGMPNLRSFFETDKKMYRAHAPFPSLTFPGISSLLKEQPISKTGIIGNSFYRNGDLIDFENPLKRKKIGELMERDTVFSRLRESGQRGVSLDYGLGINASAYSPIEDFSTAFSIAQGDFAYADAKKIDAVELLLSKYAPEDWPSFIFIHLVGVDFLAHDDGPLASTTLGYLMGLDEKLKTLLELLKQHETRHQVVTLLTADHGFSAPIKYTLDIESILAKFSNKIEVLNEARMAAVILPSTVNKDYVAQSLLVNKGVEIVAKKEGNGFTARSVGKEIKVELRKFAGCVEDEIAMSINRSAWICPSSLSAQDPLGYPFLLSNLAHYFSSSNTPDLVVIPDRETAFLKDYVGFHGGPTAEETLVPLLMRNSSLSQRQAPPLWRLLKQVID